ncbi:MAG: cold shock domain-containing protein [candidate division WOR-3 bacterium]
MYKGQVRWFNPKKGYGFIDMDSGESVFVHFSDIEGEGYKTLYEGEVVEFEIVETDKGKKAVRVKRQRR